MKKLLIPRIIKFLLQLFFRVEVRGDYQGGRHNGQKKTLIIANHSSFLDGTLLALFLPDNPVFIINTEVANNKFFKFFLRYVEHIAIDPTHPMSLKTVINLLDQGRTVAIFPEGRISNTGALMKVYGGAAFAATKSQATVIPVHISGAKQTYFSRVKGLYRPRLFPKLRLTVLPPAKIHINESLPRDKQNNDARNQMHQIMMDMWVAAREKNTIYEQLLAASSHFGKKTLVYEDGLTDDLSYGELIKKSVALSLVLEKQRFSRRVGLMLPNSNPAILTFYALQRMNKTPAIVNFTAGIRAIRAGLLACQADTIITSRKFVEKAGLESLIEQLNDYQIIYLEDLKQTVTSADKAKIAILRYLPRFGMIKQQSDDEAVVLFTSGSEGLPKGVVHSHSSALTNIFQIHATYDFSPADKIMVCLPMFHVFGLAAGALLPVVIGTPAFLYANPLHYRAIPEVIYDRDCTILLSTSTFLNGYARFADAYDFRRLRYIVAGAEKLSEQVVKTYQEQFGIRVMEGYGATETAPVIAANTAMAYQANCVGKLLPGIHAELIPVTGIDNGGQLIVRADNVMLGYLRPEKPGVIDYSPIVDGKRQYDTGDIVSVDDKGFVHIKGRVKRFAKIAGEMISLDTVEKLVQTASSEHHHAVINASDTKKGEKLILFTTDETLDKKTLQNTAKIMGLPEIAVPRELKIIKEIPVFSSGKTNYPALSETLELAA